MNLDSILFLTNVFIADISTSKTVARPGRNHRMNWGDLIAIIAAIVAATAVNVTGFLYLSSRIDTLTGNIARHGERLVRIEERMKIASAEAFEEPPGQGQ